MPFVYNFPFFCILISLASGVLCNVLKSEAAYKVTLVTVGACTAMSTALLLFMANSPEPVTYLMGHFSAPWGNEIRFGPLEAAIAVLISVVMLLIVFTEKGSVFSVVKPHRISLYYVLINLTMSSLNALVYTNDIFTSYVFIEINTLCACGLIVVKESGKTISVTIKYMIMSLLGSGLFLMSAILLYDITGHLLMPQVGEAVDQIVASGVFNVPMTIVVGLLTVSMAIKSGLYPFHSWVSHAYNNAMNSSNAISSGLIVKGYTILLIKLFYRVIGLDEVVALNVNNVIFAFGVVAIIVGSIDAVREHNIKRMLAYSSVGQIGYIYVGIGLATPEGMLAACFIIIAHSLVKSMLFVSAEGLMVVSGNSKYIEDLGGSAYRNPIAGIGFALGGFSMIGFPLLSGFVSKYLLSTAAIQSPTKMWFVLIAVAVSTILNASYFLTFIVKIYSKSEIGERDRSVTPRYKLGVTAFIVLNVALGILFQPIMNIINAGLAVL